jgi:hypothetical protein
MRKLGKLAVGGLFVAVRGCGAPLRNVQAIRFP